MDCELLRDGAGFLDAAGSFLAGNEVENTVLLGTVLRCRRKESRGAAMVIVRDGDDVRLVAIMTPPHALALSAGDPEAIPYLIDALHHADIRPPGVFGGAPLADRFAVLWTDRVPAATEPASQTILYRTSSINPPRNVPGELGTASEADVEWLAAWQRRFAEQAGLSAAELAADMRAVVAARLRRGEMFFWAVEGRPVASAAFTTTTPAGDAGRINAVFTLEEERGKGYASACVAALSRRLLEQGWRYSLIFADRSNPTTTRIYPRLGYQEVAGFASIGFRYQR